MSKVWSTNVRIIDTLVKLQSTSQTPDLQHTWFQQPVKFEDALGRVLPIPSEYNWSVYYTFLKADFSEFLTLN